MNKRIIVSAVIQKWNHVLIGRKAKWQPPYPDVWHTLGWWIDDLAKWLLLLTSKDYDNSYFHDELKREIQEEAHISIWNIENICPKFRWIPREAITKNKHWVEMHYIFLEYLCDYSIGNEKPWDDIVQLQRIQHDDLKNISLTPPSLEMYKELWWIKNTL